MFLDVRVYTILANTQGFPLVADLDLVGSTGGFLSLRGYAAQSVTSEVAGDGVLSGRKMEDRRSVVLGYWWLCGRRGGEGERHEHE